MRQFRLPGGRLAIRGVVFEFSMWVGLSRNGTKWWDLLLGDSHGDLLVNGNVNKPPKLGGEMQRMGQDVQF